MSRKYYKAIDEEVHHKHLKNGLEVYIIKKAGFKTKSAYFATKFGSFDTGDIIESDGTKLIGGLAHFLEHRLFDYKKGNAIDLYYKLGADVNAFTSYDRTVYFFNCVNHFKECLALLLDFPTSFTMKEDAVNREKDIIVNELMIYKDDPSDKLFKAIMSALYKSHPLRDDVGGEPEEVRVTTYELLKKIHQTFYTPSNMVLVICGDVDVEETFKFIEQKKFKNSNRIEVIKRDLREDTLINQNKVIVNGDVNTKRMIVGYKFKPLDEKTPYEKAKIFIGMDLLNSLLFSKSTTFYKELIEEELTTSFDYDLLSYKGAFCSLIEMDVLKDEESLLNRIKSRVANGKNALSKEKLASFKKKEMATIIKSLDSCSDLARNYLNYLLDDMDYFTLIDIIKDIDINYIEDIYHEFYSSSESASALIKKD